MPKTNDRITRAKRREQAEERQRKYDALSVQQKIVQASDRPGNSHKEVTLLGLQAGIYTRVVKMGGKLVGIAD